MAKLPRLAEAMIDDRFNAQMNKIQDAIFKLNSISLEMTTNKAIKPVRSQLFAIRQAEEDLHKIFLEMSQHV